MSNAYHQLLEATIQHLEELKARGVRFVSVSPETLAEFDREHALPTMKTPSPVIRAPQPPPGKPLAQPTPPRPPQKLPPPSAPTPPKSVLQAPVLEQSLALNLPGDATAVPARPELSPEAKRAAFAELRERAMACVKCPHLASSRRNVVFGVGNIDAELMFIGEAPGADEDEQGEPFVGKAGQLLTRIITAMGLTRDSVYIANILKCRPDTPGQASGNRKPTSEEMQTCIPYLHEQIDLIRPKVIVALGATAVEGLLGKTIGITRFRGNWQTYRGLPLMPTYHPAYLLRNQASIEKRRVWEDMMQVMEKLGMTISDKQRKFFQSST
jgi:DNA polymerase